MTDEFPVDWLDPSDPEVSWEWDDMHMPAALSELAGDYIRLLAAGMAYGHRKFAMPVEIRVQIWNGYAYFGLATDIPESKAQEPCGAVANRARPSTGTPLTESSIWRDEAVPELRAVYASVAERPGRDDAGRGSGGRLGRGLEGGRTLLVVRF